MFKGDNMKTIHVKKDFAELPWGRYRKRDGEFSGEVFREDHLVPVLERGEALLVDFHGVSEAMGSSFLSESFAGLVTESHMKISTIKKLLTLEADRPDIEEEIWEYIEEAEEG